jgi:hypothetical protein
MSDAMGLMNIAVSSVYMLVLRLTRLAPMGLRSLLVSPNPEAFVVGPLLK